MLSEKENKEYNALMDERKLMRRICLEMYPEIKKKLSEGKIHKAYELLSNCMKKGSQE